MHICLSSGWGGLEMYPSRIIPELQRQGWQVHGLALAGSRVADSLQAAGITPLTVASRGRALLAVLRILDYLRRHEIRVLHCHKSSDLRLAALLKTLRPGLRLFFTEHMGVTRPKKGLYHRWAYGKLSRMFSISEATRARNLNAFSLPAERIQRLYLGIDPGPYASGGDSETLRSELGASQGELLIGLPGRLTPGKGQDVWLEALALLTQRSPALHWHAVMIGGLTASEGSDEPYVAQLKSQVAALGLTERVSFAGFRRDLPRLLGALDIVCIPSTNEAFGLTVIEAMAAGRPVVGADSGAIPELLDSEVGLLAAPDDAEAWAVQLEALAAAPELREALGAAAAGRVRRDFTLSAHVAALSDAYASV
ncbi:glycosyltransferase family 4 protein [Halomonas sp. ML-15]|nr:glycosyltransferase family 4 protein [Halomonas sp. ML-15]